MKTATLYSQILFLFFSITVLGQNDNKKVMTSFIPKSKAYDIYYPKNFLLKENNEGIVNITDPDSILNITISSYKLDEETNDEKLIEQLSGFIKNQFSKEITRHNWNSYKTKFDILVELKISDTKMNWVWWGVVNKTTLVVLSITKPLCTESAEVCFDERLKVSPF